MKSWLPDNDIEIYLIQNKGESVVSERLVRILKKKIYSYLTILVKLVHVHKLAEIVNKCSNNTYSTIKMKPAHVKSRNLF